VRISAESLAAFAKAWGMGEKQKGEALKRLLQQHKRTIILINPDILYLLYSMRYRGSQDILALFQAFTTIVFDEFHLYSGVELAHVLFLIHLARAMHAFPRVVLLSATPNAEVKTYLERLLAPHWINADVTVPYPICGERTVAHCIDLQPLPVYGDIVATTVRKILDLQEKLTALREANREGNAQGEYIPCVVILNSVIDAIALEDALVKAGIARMEMAPFRGLSARSSRVVNGKLLVIGTAAIEVGIDFKTDYLIFEAGDAASFMQRFGRLGRHREGIAYLLGGVRECQAISTFENQMMRDRLECLISEIYPMQEAYAWFADTLGGAYTILAQVENLRMRIKDERIAADELLEELECWLSATLTDYSERMRFTAISRAKAKVKRHLQWFEHYRAIETFRTSLPNQEVWDVSEHLRERDWCYTADVKMLLTRAERLWYNENHQRLYVSGYGKYHSVWFAKSFDEMGDALCGVINTTEKYPEESQFIRDGHLTSVSHVMSKPKHHIFTFVPAEISRQLDWRLPWFPCGSKHGRFIIAFDGDALLLSEIYRKQKP
jgi:CRISPR-associated helicase Cas3